MNSLVRFVYGLPLSQAALVVLIGLVCWALIGRKASFGRRPQSWRALNFIIVIFSLAAILFMTTVYSRGTEGFELDLMPFRPIIEGPYYAEYLRTMFMNILLFVPFGMGLAWTLNSRWKKLTILLVTILGLALSIGVEYIQFKYQLGSVETDDVIMNTLGALLGAMTLIGRRNK